MHAAKRSQERAKRCTRSFTTIAVDFAHAIAIIIPRPLVLTVIDGRVVLHDPMVTAIVVGVNDRPIRRNCFSENTVTSGCIAVRDYPTALFARVATDDMNDRRSVVVIGAMARLLIRAAAGRVIRVAVRVAFFPPR